MWIYPSMIEMIKRVGLKSIQDYIIDKQKHVQKHFTEDNGPITEMISSLDIDVNMERVIWWKTIPEPEP